MVLMLRASRLVFVGSLGMRLLILVLIMLMRRLNSRVIRLRLRGRVLRIESLYCDPEGTVGSMAAVALLF